MATTAVRYREEIERIGLSDSHKQVIAWVTEGARVLELGCASGYTGKILMETKGCRVTGVEVDPDAAREARASGLEVFQGSLEDPAFRDSIAGKFDFVLAADVLEHLRAPASVLAHIKRWLLPHGRAVVAVPNVAAWPIRSQLFFRGDFEYQDTGILDRTHLHFFTWDTLHKLLREQHWSVVDSMCDWTLPVGRGVLLHAPKDARVYVENLAKGHAAEAIVGASVGRWLGGIEKAGQGIANRIFRRWPNACAAHITLLLAPEDETAAGHVSPGRRAERA